MDIAHDFTKYTEFEQPLNKWLNPNIHTQRDRKRANEYVNRENLMHHTISDRDLHLNILLANFLKRINLKYLFRVNVAASSSIFALYRYH